MRLTECKSGYDFEVWVEGFLRALGLKVARTKGGDNGVDVVATVKHKGLKSNFCIQCKYYNKPVSKQPIQEIYTGVNYYKVDATPVLMTNNRVTFETRAYAKRLGVEVIGDREIKEIEEVIKTYKANTSRTGLLGIIISILVGDKDSLTRNLSTKEVIQDNKGRQDYKESLKQELIDKFNLAELHAEEAERLLYEANKHTKEVLRLQKEALIQNLDYG